MYPHDNVHVTRSAGRYCESYQQHISRTCQTSDTFSSNTADGTQADDPGLRDNEAGEYGQAVLLQLQWRLLYPRIEQEASRLGRHRRRWRGTEDGVFLRGTTVECQSITVSGPQHSLIQTHSTM
jgi:hypothetical protein